ncbi:MAG TPA: 50S ribosomal protein L6 [Bacteroidales bacterium]|nr:MAG: 50S ribosomal protein L6 [Bacteroidetes bacterium GWE2_42_24]OFY29276.1 MAG: 50S ribosomal protein L6 [Bacteroidetes bacterium GWF2_43_11]HBZ66732.1 50S ribosomal protein L6 [Bacteroidales bacterium]
MSRIGKQPINIPAGTQVTVSSDNLVTVKGKVGTLTQQVDPRLAVKLEGTHLLMENPEPGNMDLSAKHGLYRSLVANMVKGVSEGFKLVQELVGVGYKAQATGQLLELSLGFSHNLFIELAPEIKVTTVTERGKNPIITLESCDKQLLGMVASRIRAFRRPEPYKGKGVRFVNEVVRRKAGKTASSK